MYIVAIAWLYVTLLMAVVEATSSTGTVLGAIITLALYGALPMGVVLYVMGAPARRRAIKAREAAEWAAARIQTELPITPDAHREATTDAVAPMGEKT